MPGAVVLAAGASSRMGEPKGLLQVRGKTVLLRMTTALQSLGFSPICVVVGADAPSYAAQVPRSGFEYVVNDRWPQGRTSSVKAGLRAVHADRKGALVWPVDHPFVSRQTVRQVLDTARRTGHAWVVPVHSGQRGHPPLVGPEAARAVLEFGDDEPLHAFPRDHPDDVLEVEVADPGIHLNVDTPEDLEKALLAMGPYD